MRDVVVEASPLVSQATVRRVKRDLPKAISAVEAYLAVRVPAVTVVVAGRTGLATWSLRALGGRGDARARRQYWREEFAEAATVYGYTTVMTSGRALIGLYARPRRKQPETVFPTLVHELVHAVQLDRPGRRDERRQMQDRRLGLVEHPMGLVMAMSALQTLDEGEAYAVQHALCPESAVGDEFGGGSFDPGPVVSCLGEAVKNWAATAR
ncbi:hypothetical protein ACFY97_18735 [Streptomyces klenkii]|uniref:hypothetical protein n=1 Tax=Streptomyces klenkii TaxID=1420899 RepID=UPI0036EDFCA8